MPRICSTVVKVPGKAPDNNNKNNNNNNNKNAGSTRTQPRPALNRKPSLSPSPPRAGPSRTRSTPSRTLPRPAPLFRPRSRAPPRPKYPGRTKAEALRAIRPETRPLPRFKSTPIPRRSLTSHPIPDELIAFDDKDAFLHSVEIGDPHVDGLDREKVPCDWEAPGKPDDYREYFGRTRLVTRRYIPGMPIDKCWGDLLHRIKEARAMLLDIPAFLTGKRQDFASPEDMERVVRWLEESVNHDDHVVRAVGAMVAFTLNMRLCAWRPNREGEEPYQLGYHRVPDLVLFTPSVSRRLCAVAGLDKTHNIPKILPGSNCVSFTKEKKLKNPDGASGSGSVSGPRRVRVKPRTHMVPYSDLLKKIQVSAKVFASQVPDDEWWRGLSVVSGSQYSKVRMDLLVEMEQDISSSLRTAGISRENQERRLEQAGFSTDPRAKEKPRLLSSVDKVARRARETVAKLANVATRDSGRGRKRVEQRRPQGARQERSRRGTPRREEPRRGKASRGVARPAPPAASKGKLGRDRGPRTTGRRPRTEDRGPRTEHLRLNPNTSVWERLG